MSGFTNEFVWYGGEVWSMILRCDATLICIHCGEKTERAESVNVMSFYCNTCKQWNDIEQAEIQDNSGLVLQISAFDSMCENIDREWPW